MFRKPRFSNETWVEYVQRATHEIEDKVRNASSDNWVVQSWRIKFKFAAKMALVDDGRWTKRLLEWKPWFPKGRQVGRPCTRWSDKFTKIAGEGWTEAAKEPDTWSLMCEV